MHATVEDGRSVHVRLKQGKMAIKEAGHEWGRNKGGWDWEGKLGWCICFWHTRQLIRVRSPQCYAVYAAKSSSRLCKGNH